MKMVTDKTKCGVESVLLAPADLAEKFQDIFYGLAHTGYTPRGTILTVSLNVLKDDLAECGITTDGERDLNEEIMEACKIAAKRFPQKFEFALYRDPRDPRHAEIGLRYYLTNKP